MFDQPTNPNLNQPAKPATASGPAPMPPVREMFKEPEDILGEVDRIQPARPEAPRPSTPAFGGTRPTPAVNPLSAPTASLPVLPRPAKSSMFRNWKKILIISAVVIVGGGFLSAAAYYGYVVVSQMMAPKTVINANQNIINTNRQVAPVNTNTGPVDQTPTQPAVVPVQPEVPVDTDKDGLTDSEERLYGTDSTNSDTDNDGLTDRDEVKIFKTDPNNPDTDGDTYIDGKEVLSGYDPKGPGKLLKIPTEE